MAHTAQCIPDPEKTDGTLLERCEGMASSPFRVKGSACTVFVADDSPWCVHSPNGTRAYRPAIFCPFCGVRLIRGNGENHEDHD